MITALDRLISDHKRDEDCIVDPDTHRCIGCDREHFEPCPYCDAKAFHLASCPCMLSIVEAESVEREGLEWSCIGRTRNLNTLTPAIVLAFVSLVGLFYWAAWRVW